MAVATAAAAILFLRKGQRLVLSFAPYVYIYVCSTVVGIQNYRPEMTRLFIHSILHHLKMVKKAKIYLDTICKFRP